MWSVKISSLVNATSLQSLLDQLYDGYLVVCSAEATDYIGKLYSILLKNLKGSILLMAQRDISPKKKFSY